jgi:hypothetical protein
MQDREAQTATVELVHPFEDPISYDTSRLDAQMRDLAARSGAELPELDSLSLASAAAANDRASAAYLLRPLKDWLRRDPPYDILEADKGDVDVPFLLAGAPEVEQIEVEAALTTTKGHGGTLEFKVAGTGPSADAKLTVSSGYSIKPGPGEVLIAVVTLPVLWEKRAFKGDPDKGVWLHIEPSDTRKAPIAVRSVASLPDYLTADWLDIDNTLAGVNPAEVTRSYAVEANLGFSIGFKADAVGLDATLSAKAEHTMTVELTANLPRGHRYRVSWLGAPAGVAVSA